MLATSRKLIILSNLALGGESIAIAVGGVLLLPIGVDIRPSQSAGLGSHTSYGTGSNMGDDLDHVYS